MAKRGMRRSVTPPKDDEQDRGEADEGVDAVGVEEAAAADLEGVRQVVVHRRWRG